MADPRQERPGTLVAYLLVFGAIFSPLIMTMLIAAGWELLHLVGVT